VVAAPGGQSTIFSLGNNFWGTVEGTVSTNSLN
jgi:hypothetical protein